MHSIPTTKDLRAQLQAKFESKLNENVPDFPYAFTKLLSVVLAMIAVPIYKYIDSAKKQSLALTADEEGLTEIARNYNIPREPAATVEIEVEFDVTDNVTLPKTATYKTDNELLYYPKQTYVYTFTGPSPETKSAVLVGEKSGTEYNLSVGDTLDIEYEINDIGKTATVTAINVYGSDQESIEEHRRHVLNEIGTVGGGGNNVDYRRWAEATPGVYRAFPYAGRPDDPDSAVPGERTVFIEADAELGGDGIPTTGLIDDVRDNLQYDPDTGETRPPVTDTIDDLRVLPIEHVEFRFNISDLIIDAGVLPEAREKVETAVDEHLRSVAPYVVGLDREYERSDKVSSVSVSNVVSDNLKLFGGEAGVITMDVINEGNDVSMRQLIGGEVARLSSIEWV